MPDSIPTPINLAGNTVVINNGEGVEGVLGMLDQAAGVVRSSEVKRAIVILLQDDCNHAIYSVGLTDGEQHMALESAQMNILADNGWI